MRQGRGPRRAARAERPARRSPAQRLALRPRPRNGAASRPLCWRRRGVCPSVPVRVVSGSDLTLARLGGVAPEGFLAKPWELGELLAKVARLRDAPRTPADGAAG